MTDPTNYHPCPWCSTVFATNRALGMHLLRCTQDDPHPPSHRHPPGRRMHCYTCSLTHTPRCKPFPMWPLQPLLDMVTTDNAPALFGLGGQTWAKAISDGLTDAQADRIAIRCGFHPEQVWPGWLDAGLTVVDRQKLEGGWRPAWLYGETPHRTEAAA